MPTFNFRGFQTGSEVAISALQSGIIATGSVPNWGQNMASLNILSVDSGERVAPSGVWFEVTDIAGFDVSGGPGPDETYDPSFHEITYIWSFDDPGSFSTPLNAPNAWNDRNVAYGKQVAHVFNDPGTYEVTVWAVDASGTTATASKTITIADPDAAYSGARTIVVAQDGDFTGAPAGADQKTNLSTAVSAYNALGHTGRILLKRGETYSGAKIQIGVSENFRCGAWGTGNRPLLTPLAQSSGGDNNEIFRLSGGSPIRDYCFYDLDLQGPWDPTTLTGDPRFIPFYWLFHSGAASPAYVVHNTRIAGFARINTSNLEPANSLTIFSECEVTDWQDYGLFGHGDMTDGRLGVVGCSVYQNPDACHNGGKDGFGNDHGPWRNSSTLKVYGGGSEFFSNTGWSAGPPGVTTAAQPCIRVSSGGLIGRTWNLERITCEGGFHIIRNTGASGTRTDNPGNVMCDKMLLVGTAQTEQFFPTHHGGTTKRNILAIMPSVKEYSGGANNFFGFGTDNNQAGNLDARQALYNCTALNLHRETDNGDDDVNFSFGSGSFTDIFIENNVYHAPLQQTPEISDAPIDTSMPLTGFTPRYVGLRTAPSRTYHTLQSDLPDGQSFTEDYPDGYGQADFTPGSGHALSVDFDDYYFEINGDVAFTFNASNITITNASGTVWASGDIVRAVLVPYNLATDASYASPASLPLPRPASGSAAIGVSAGLLAYDDFLGSVRSTPQTRGALDFPA